MQVKIAEPWKNILKEEFENRILKSWLFLLKMIIKILHAIPKDLIFLQLLIFVVLMI